MTHGQIYGHFGKEKPKGVVLTQTHQNAISAIQDCIADRTWLAMYGHIGMGKTETVYQAMSQIIDLYGDTLNVVTTYNPERKSYKIGDIQSEIILQCGQRYDEGSSVKKSKQDRTRQALNIVSKIYKRKHHLLLLIDEAHELHFNTIKSLKRIREFNWAGVRTEMSILMIGQMPLEGMIRGDDEIGPRCETYHFELALGELARIAHFYTVGLLNDEQAIQVAARYKRTHAIRQACLTALEHAANADKDSLDLNDFPDFELPEVNTRKRGGKTKLNEDKLNNLYSQIGGIKAASNQ